MEAKGTIKKKGVFKSLIDNVVDNVKEGASFVGEKVAETSAKAYVAGTELVADTSEKIHDYTEKQTLHKEEEKIEKEKQILSAKFGELTLAHYLANDSLHKPFLTSSEVKTVVDEYKAYNERLEEIAKALKKLEQYK